MGLRVECLPLLTAAAFCPQVILCECWQASQAQTVKFGGCSISPLRELEHRAGARASSVAHHTSVGSPRHVAHGVAGGVETMGGGGGAMGAHFAAPYPTGCNWFLDCDPLLCTTPEAPSQPPPPPKHTISRVTMKGWLGRGGGGAGGIKEGSGSEGVERSARHLPPPTLSSSPPAISSTSARPSPAQVAGVGWKLVAVGGCGRYHAYYCVCRGVGGCGGASGVVQSSGGGGGLCCG